MDQINNNPNIKFYSTYFYNGSDSPTYVTKELSPLAGKRYYSGFYWRSI